MSSVSFSGLKIQDKQTKEVLESYMEKKHSGVCKTPIAASLALVDKAAGDEDVFLTARHFDDFQYSSKSYYGQHLFGTNFIFTDSDGNFIDGTGISDNSNSYKFILAFSDICAKISDYYSKTEVKSASQILDQYV